MTQQANDELTVLDRIMYMLEERSVTHLASNDSSFAELIEELYAQASAHADRLAIA